MAEYIDKDALLNYLFNKQDEPLDVMKEIAEFAAADIATVQHGRWISGLSGDYKICSGCHQIADFAFDYCPNCGSFMDGGDGE